MKKLAYITAVILLFLFGCKRDTIYTGSDAKLIFSTDTIEFDTVFRSIGSATKVVKVYNPLSQSVEISRIYLARGENTPFKININGKPASSAENIIIQPKDSIYLFAEVTIDPGVGDLVEQDSIIFEINGNRQDIKLVAFGWDVHLINGDTLTTQTWTADKPYLIYNYALVDTGQTLTIEEGTRIFSHKNSYILVFGSIQVLGSKDKPVIFSADRLEEDYKDIPGQWGGIVLYRTSERNLFNYATIINATIGLAIDSVRTDTVFVTNCDIEHHSYAGIFAGASNVTGLNSIIADCGWYALALIQGGNYTFYDCTIANFYSWQPRNTPSIALTNYLIIDNTPVYWTPLKADFANCIIWGNRDNEISATSASGTNNFEVNFEYNLIKQKDDFPCINCIINKDPLFGSINNFDYHLSAGSPAIGTGNLDILNIYPTVLQYDLEGNDRISDNRVDLGAYQYRENL